MLKSIIDTSIRNILRYKVFSAINFIGLASGMSLGLLIIILLQEQFLFDRFHAEGDRIYRVNTMAIRTDGTREPYASAPLPLGKVIYDDYTFAEQVVLVDNSIRTEGRYGLVEVPIHGLYASPTFLEVFHFPMHKGDNHLALSTPYSIVLSKSAAKKLAGTSDPMGQTVTLDGLGEYTVTGVLEEFPGHTHFDFEVLISLSSMEMGHSIQSNMKAIDDWNNYYSGYVYITLAHGQSTEHVENSLKQIVATHYADLPLEARDR
jgi:putative ABC transport system permease protein